MENKIDFEVGIIGGGPAGSSLAAYLAKENISCVLFEKENFPRPHVGESLVPSTNRVLKEIGALGAVDAAGFPKKYGAAWQAYNSKEYNHNFEGIPEDLKVDIRFDERKMDLNRNHTYHVDRAKFDQILLNNAKKLGAKIYEGTRVNKVLIKDVQYPEIYAKIDGSIQNFRTKLIVDASGRNTFLGNKLNIKVKDPEFDQYAIHTWFKDYDRGTNGKSEYIYIYFFPIPNTWMWQIPITDTITSIGIVTQKEYFASSSEDRKSFFWDCIAKFPLINERLKNATQVNPLKAEGDYSYSMEEFVGNGWALIGDAARFVDPIFSSGVSVALGSARFLSHDIIRGLKGDVKNRAFIHSDFKTYKRNLSNGIKNWHKFIKLYYRLNLLFTKYIHSPKYRLDVLKLLSGDVYDEESPEVLTKMQEFIDEIEANKNHMLHHLLGGIGTTDSDSANAN